MLLSRCFRKKILSFNQLNQLKHVEFLSVNTLNINLPPPVDLVYEEINITKAGPDKPPLLILHGLFGNKGNWKSTGRALSHACSKRVLVIDLRNHGESPHVDYGPNPYYAMSADLKHLMERLDIKSCHIMGHSMGGRVTSAFTYLFVSTTNCSK